MQPTKTIPEGYRKDAQGRLVPEESIKPVDLLRDSLVQELARASKEMRGILKSFRDQLFSNIETFITLSAEKYGIAIGGEKGNISLLSFDGKYRITRVVADLLFFDERLQVAKQLIDECISEWAKDSSKEIRTLINDAFQVDKRGRINTQRVLSLRRLNFDHPKWLQAMEAISDSLSIASSKSYVRIYERDDKGEYQQINLDIANV